MSTTRFRPITATGVLAPLLLGACHHPPHATPLSCDAHAPLAAEGLARGVPVETTPTGRCLAAMADAGDVAAELRLGDFYHEQKGALPLIDTRGRQIHWYRLAANRGSAQGAWQAARLIDKDPQWQVPNDALAYTFTAIKGGVPEAADYLIDQWQAGRIDAGKLYAFRRWLDRDKTLPADEKQEIVEGLDAPADELESE
ncbi:hypothetical protein Y88_0221 [Novosphingobium nitrogenifigens DSM 19370]|uniref:Lipoprotein n=1 Tax=Novosphingobium nitrogenifigens DSM 19370 TaxID=983920 RepID=F1ZBD3_9SPHN|nr:hypothetical protein [Novosphingobium nitrogenifigens]EGD58169.1 hypothetical protein Y88_0221 [Novosphingobium nitrogenifigens DSM 19370]